MFQWPLNMRLLQIESINLLNLAQDDKSLGLSESKAFAGDKCY